MGDVYRIESHQSSPQTNVGFCEGVTHQIALLTQPLFQLVKPVEQRRDSFVIGVLTGGKTTLVHAIIHIVIHALVNGIDVGLECIRIVIPRRGTQCIKAAVEHANNVCRLIADNRFALRIPQHGHCDTTAVAIIGFQVKLIQFAEAVQLIASRAGKVIAQLPTVSQHVGMDHRDTDVVLQPFQGTHDQGAMRPGTGIGHIQVVTPTFRRETLVSTGARTAVRRHPVTELTLRALEAATGAFGVVPFVLPLSIH